MTRLRAFARAKIKSIYLVRNDKCACSRDKLIRDAITLERAINESINYLRSQSEIK